MANEQLISEIVSPKANEQVLSLTANLKTAEQQLQATIVQAKALNDNLSSSKGYSNFNKSAADAQKATEAIAKAAAQRQLAEEKLAAFQATAAAKAEAIQAKQIAADNAKLKRIADIEAREQAAAAKKAASDQQASAAALKYIQDQAAAANAATAYGKAVNASTQATNQNNLSKKQIAQAIAEEKYRLQQSTAELKNNAKEMLNAKGSIEQRRAALARLTLAYDQLSASERNTSYGQRLGDTIGNLSAKINELDAAKKKDKDSTDNASNSYKKLATEVLGAIAAYVSFNAIVNAAKKIFNENVDISDNFVDVQRTAKLSTEEVDALVVSLKQINTRTTLEGLLEIGFIGGRLGIAKKDLVGFIQTVDELAVVLKKEFPGGAEAIANSLGKVITVYKITKRENISLEQALKNTGSTFLELAHNGQVTVQYLQDFALRTAGVAQIAKISLPTMLAYGAVLSQAGITAQVAGSSVTRLISSLATKRDKYFAIAQLADSTLTLKEFTRLINTDTKYALELFFKGLKAGNPSQTEFSDRLKTLALTTGAAKNAVIALAENQDLLFQKTKIANQANEEGSSVAHNFELANNSLAASFDKLKNASLNFFTNPNSGFYKWVKVQVDDITKGIGVIDRLLDRFKRAQEDEILFSTNRDYRNSKGGAEEIAAIRSKRVKEASEALNQSIQDRGTASANLMSAGKSELEIRKLLTGAIIKQRIELDRLNNALDFVRNPKNSQDRVDIVSKRINGLRAAAAQQNAVVAALRSKLPGQATITGDGTELDTPATEAEKRKAESNARKNAAAMIQIQIDALKQAQDIYRQQSESQNFSTDARLEGLKNFTDVSLQIADLEGKKEIAAQVKTESEKKAIISKSENEQLKIKSDSSDKAIVITREGLARTKGIIAEQAAKDLTATEKLRDAELSALTDRLNKGQISTIEYDKKRSEIEEKYTEKYISLQIEQTQAYIDSAKLRGENTESEEAKLAAIKLRYGQIAVDRQKRWNNELSEEADDLLQKDIERAEVVKQITQELFDFGKALGNAAFTRSINNIEREKSALTEKTNLQITNIQAEGINEKERIDRTREINSDLSLTEKERAAKIQALNEEIGNSEQNKADRIAVINAKAASDQAVLDERIKQQKIKQAKFDKAAAIAQIIIQTALAQIKIIGETGLLGFVFSPLVTALGAISLATAIATPIPEYKTGKGRGDNYSGPAIVGDGGMSELVIEPDGRMYVTPDKPTMTNVSSDTQIVSGPEFKRMLANPNVNHNVEGKSVDISRLVQSNDRMGDRVEKAIGKQKINAYIETEKGRIRRQQSVTKHNNWISRNFRR